jgi:hypothetical protein
MRAATAGLGRRPGAELGHIGAADDHEPGAQELLDQVRRRPGAPIGVAEEACAPVDRVAGAIPRRQVLQQERYPPERAVRQRTLRFLAGAGEVLVDHGVQPRIQLLDAADRLVDELARRDLPAPHGFGLTHGIAIPDFGVSVVHRAYMASTRGSSKDARRA